MTNSLISLAERLEAADLSRLCVNCAHCAWDEGPTCVRPISAERSAVDGALTDRLHTFCQNERRAGKTLLTRRQRCGPEGRYFKQAPPPTRAAQSPETDHG